MRRIEVPLGNRAYTIFVGAGLRFDQTLLSVGNAKKVAIVSNETIAPLYLDDIRRTLMASGVDSFSIVLPDGEQFKDWSSLNSIFDALLSNRCERSTPIYALGGGVIGDTVGFAAACYQRGAPFVQIPTTLLSQVDSSVGGKTAINHPLGKNMIGAFHQPRRVIIDTETLNSLPDREFRSGLAEVIKYGLIRDLPFLEWLELNMHAVMKRDPDALIEIIARSCSNKSEVVVADETEQGERALLNLGHTFGHAIETGLGYGEWLHGEAVAVGTMMAAELSRIVGWLSDDDVLRIEKLNAAAGLPLMGPKSVTPAQYLDLMSHDKKVLDGSIRFVLIKTLGMAQLYSDATTEQILTAIKKRTAI